MLCAVLLLLEVIALISCLFVEQIKIDIANESFIPAILNFLSGLFVHLCTSPPITAQLVEAYGHPS